MCTYLIRRGATYYFRRVIPSDLRAAMGGKREFTVSLGTKDREAAKRLIPDHAQASEEALDAARSRLARTAAMVVPGEAEAPPVISPMPTPSELERHDAVSCAWACPALIAPVFSRWHAKGVV